MTSANHWFNIEGCLEKYRDLETASRWLQRAKGELSAADFDKVTEQLHSWVLQRPSFHDLSTAIYDLLAIHDPANDSKRRADYVSLVNHHKHERKRLQIEAAEHLRQHEIRAAAELHKKMHLEELARKEAAERRTQDEIRVAAELRKKLQSEVLARLDSNDSLGADLLYEEQCASWWKRADYETAKASCQYVQHFVEHYRNGSLAELDTCFHQRPMSVELSADEFSVIKTPKVRRKLAEMGMLLDNEQVYASSRPEYCLLIKARAGSGKTRTLCARAALAIQDEKLDPNQVLILAFNKTAAAEVKHRVQEMGGIADYDNARTFHSLAYQLVKKPKRKLLFDNGGHLSERGQSLFAQRMLHRILNPAFKEAMVEFFRQELETIETIGRDLPPEEYQVFRRALEHVSLRGYRVKSSGEKFIADFLFEHDIEHRYEHAWAWKTDFLDGGTYRPDFSIIANGKDYIHEHWAIDPDDQFAILPKHWDITADQYRRQIGDKRDFWKSKEKPLLETHTGLMAGGRVAFEKQLRGIFENAGIRCQRLPQEEIVRRVFENDFTISKMAELFLQFIKHAKKRFWSADDVAVRIATQSDREPRAHMFHNLALRAYREYESMLAEEQAMDFDDLLVQAAEEVKALGASASIHLGQGSMMPIRDLRWILLDEYQDFSELYSRMLSAILEVTPNVRLVAVGDDWQAINAFAGADLRFFSGFSDYFPGAKSVGVTTNYRSDRAVVTAGNLLMKGRGAPAKVSQSATGEITKSYLGDIWIQFKRDPQREEQWQADSIFLPPRVDGKGPTESALRQAQALKICMQIAQSAPGQRILLLARTNRVYGLDLGEYRKRLIQVLSTSLKVKPESIEDLIAAMTAHRSKGQQAHTVIILDATQRQFPKIHPDNLLFELFGVTPHAVLEEERRLFYVAVTRAKHRLFVLTNKGEESPYLTAIEGDTLFAGEVNDSSHTQTHKLGELATRILARTGY